ncbi:MAG: SET domain-containing protein [Bacteroidetes bacterium]|nr:SET domain-containing protein [Bacteroidota bacterium]
MNRLKISFETDLVGNAFVKEQWDEICDLMRTAFSGSRFPDGFNPERPAKLTWNEMEKEGDNLEHVIALNDNGRLIGAVLCVPTKRPLGETACNVGRHFVDTSLPELQRARVADALISRLHRELARSGYKTIITKMETDSGAEYLSMRHGYIPAPTKDRKNRWITSLRTASENEINRKSAKRSWTGIKGQEGRYATTNIKKEEIILDLKAIMERVKSPSAHTLQLAEGYYYRSWIGSLSLNHSCKPNGYFCFDDLTYRALHDIAAGEVLTFHYCTTEYELANPFDCLCGSHGCLGQVCGFKFLGKDEIEKIAPILSPFLRSKL